MIKIPKLTSRQFIERQNCKHCLTEVCGKEAVQIPCECGHDSNKHSITHPHECRIVSGLKMCMCSGFKVLKPEVLV